MRKSIDSSMNESSIDSFMTPNVETPQALFNFMKGQLASIFIQITLETLSIC